MSEDFYNALGVSQNASKGEIKNVCRKKAAKYHPDIFDEDDAKEEFKKVQKTKEMFADDKKWQIYDQVGHERFQQSQRRGDGGDDRGRGDPLGGGGNPLDGMGGGDGGFKGILNDLFNGDAGGQQRSRPQQGRNVAQRISIDLEDAYHDVERDMTIRRCGVCPECDDEGHPEDIDVNTCSECNGLGQQTTVQQTPFGRTQQMTTCHACGGEGETYSEDCSECRGGGRVRRTRDTTITIPAGFRDDQRLHYRGEDEPGEDGGPNGDLFIEVDVRDHDELDRDGDDLRYTHPISSSQAVFGATVEMPTLDGKEELEVPVGTRNGSTFTVFGTGMPHLDGRGNGDLRIEVHVVTPEDLNNERHEVLKEFAETGGEEVKEGPFQKLKNSP